MRTPLGLLDVGRSRVGIAVAVVVALVVFGLLALVLVALFATRALDDADGGVPVRADVTMTPQATGVRVSATLRAVSGSLPDSVTVPAQDEEARYATTSGEQADVGVAAPVLSARVGGRVVEPGAEVEIDGDSVLVEYVVGPREDGTLVAYTPTTFGSVEVVQVRATLEGIPVSCLQPEGRRANQDRTWVRACDGSPVSARRGPPTTSGYADIDIPAWVRVSYRAGR